MTRLDFRNREPLPVAATSHARRFAAVPIVASMAFAAIATACAAGTGSGSCSQAYVGRAPSSPLEPGASGFVQFEFEKETLQGPVMGGPAGAPTSTTKITTQCTALFDYPVVDGRTRVRLWTASHCVGRDLAELTGITAVVSMGDFFVEIPLTHDFVELKRKAAARVAEIAPSERVWETIFAWNLALESNPVAAPACRDPVVGVSTYKSDPGTQELCFSWSDLLVLVADAPNRDPQAHTGVPAFDFTIGFPSDAADFLGAHADLTRLKRELAAAKALDAYFACERFLASGATPGPTDCTRAQNATYAEVLKGLAFPGRDLIAEGTSRGFGLRRGAAEEDVRLRMSAARARVTRSWRYIANRITASAVPATVVAADKPSARFNELKLASLGTKPSYLVEDTGLRMRVPKDGKGVGFGRGDSGSILSLQGHAPVLALQSVDNGETSGGASVVALPVRRSAVEGRGERQRTTTSDARGEGRIGGNEGTASRGEPGCG